MTKVGPPFLYTPEEARQKDREANQRYYRRNKEKILKQKADHHHANLEKRRDIERRSREKYPERYLVRTSRYNANVKGLPHTITEADILIPPQCPVLKVPFAYRTPYAISVDRIDSTKGYVPGNIQIMSRKANIMKNNATADELRSFAEWVLS